MAEAEVEKDVELQVNPDAEKFESSYAPSDDETLEEELPKPGFDACTRDNC